MFLQNIILCIALIGFVESVEFPQYIQKCRQSEFEKCGPEAANKALLYLLNGDKRYNIPSFYPLQLGQIDFNYPQFKFNLQRSTLGDFRGINVYRTKYEEPIFKFAFLMNKLTLLGEYTKDARIFDLILVKPGYANFTLNQVNVKVELLFNTYKDLGGHRRGSPFRADIHIEAESMRFTFKEQVNGLPYLAIEDSETINKLVMPTFKAVLNQAIDESVGRLSAYFSSEDIWAPPY